MTFTEERKGEVLILGPSDRIDNENSTVLLGKITQVIDGGVRNLLLDFSSVTYVTSAGLRPGIRDQGRAKAFLHPSPSAKCLFS